MPATSSMRPHLVEVLGVRVVQALDHLGRRLRDGHDLGRVPVERPHRVDLDPGALVGIEHVVAEQELAQLARILGARVRIADARQVQAHARQAEPRIQVREQVDQLGVDGGVVGADGLRADLAVLAVAAGLRRLVAEHRSGVPELHGLGQLVHAVLEIGPAHRGRTLRAAG